jgi:aldose 1-epimerase
MKHGTVELACGAARVALAPDVGGAVAAFDWDAVPVLRPTPRDALEQRDVRRMASYPLVPYSNRIADARLTFNGSQYELARNFGDHPHALHGVGWQRAWQVREANETHAWLELFHDADGVAASAWPWSFEATQFFHLSATDRGATLSMRLKIVNHANQPFPFGLGWHPYFRKRPQTTLELACDGVWLTDPTVLPRAHTTVPLEWNFGAARALGTLQVDNVFTGWRGQVLLDDARDPFSLSIAADSACRFVVMYAPPDADFIAIEPVTNMTDAFNHASAGEAATGTRLLPPGGAFSCTMRLTVASRRAA